MCADKWVHSTHYTVCNKCHVFQFDTLALVFIDTILATLEITVHLYEIMFLFLMTAIRLCSDLWLYEQWKVEECSRVEFFWPNSGPEFCVRFVRYCILKVCNPVNFEGPGFGFGLSIS